MRNLLKRRVLAALVLGTAIVGGTLVYAQAAKVTTTYRTALVTYGTITQSIGMAGNLTPVSEADLNFASAGTVQSVYVQIGQAVGAGTPLGTVDSTLLSAQLLQAQATLASAQAKLAQDRSGPTGSSLTSAQNSVGSAQVAMNNAQTSLADTQAINAQAVAVAQAPVTTAQGPVTADLALVAQDNVTLTADQATMATDCALAGPPPACATDTTKVSADQAKLATDQLTLAQHQATLDSSKVALATATAKAQQSNDQAAAQLASMQQQYSAAKSSLASLQTSTAPQTIQMDDAQITIDQVNVDTMQRQVDGATLTSPIAGIVSQVNVKVGQSVSSGSATSAFIVFAPGSYQVTGTVSDSQVNLVAVGQGAQVTPAGSTQALLGKITAISPAATISSGVATFGVTAQLTDTSNAIRPGISATVSIVINQVVHVLTVPTSAVHTTAGGSTVQVLTNGVPKSVSVQTGASDPTRIQILSGLQINQVVVIAVVTSTVPSSTGNAFGGGGGNRGGGGGGVVRPGG
ncbi:MAG TPA: HlyD family efflux transporter periplasmic adaptor subunit [Candidatus Dormibacteraeota bacterium]|nr:HlyD family efflux transporter periplasmic adaptor subunit [Candidatus Dormibacteraeota bacterium]